MAAIISVHAVIKGYHVYHKRPEIGTELRCEPDLDNQVDDFAMGVLDANSEMVGHVPAHPITLNKAFFDLWKNEQAPRITCEVTGEPQGSHEPWAEVNEKGGGAVIPCVYRLHCELGCDSHVWGRLTQVAGEKPGVIRVEREGNSIDGARQKCRFFFGKGCRFGDGCKFSHSDGETTADERPVCNFYLKNAWCRFGDRCKYSHGLAAGANGFDFDPNRVDAGDYSDEYEEIEERGQHFGFTKEEFDTLLSFGIKPWGNWQQARYFLEQLDNIDENGGVLYYDSDEGAAAPPVRSVPKAANSQEKVCRFFQQNGFCRYGDDCRFSHGDGPQSAPVTNGHDNQPPCRFYQTSRGCRNGANCRFSHVD